MEKLKCSSCGAELEVEENKEYAKCNHCGTKYKLNEDLNINFKIDDNTKEVLTKGLGNIQCFSILLLVPILAFIIIIVTSIGIHSRNSRITTNTQDDTFEKQEQQVENFINGIKEEIDNQQEDAKKQEDEMKKYTFNFQFIYDNGTKADLFVKSTLDKIIQSNKTNDRKIALAFNGTETTDESEIINIKQSLSGTYEVLIDYDEEGYINKITVEKIN